MTSRMPLLRSNSFDYWKWICWCFFLRSFVRLYGFRKETDRTVYSKRLRRATSSRKKGKQNVARGDIFHIPNNTSKWLSALAPFFASGHLPVGIVSRRRWQRFHLPIIMWWACVFFSGINRIRLESCEDQMHSCTNTAEYVVRTSGTANDAGTDARLRLYSRMEFRSTAQPQPHSIQRKPKRKRTVCVRRTYTHLFYFFWKQLMHAAWRSARPWTAAHVAHQWDRSGCMISLFRRI